jgi:hypothetical protein
LSSPAPAAIPAIQPQSSERGREKALHEVQIACLSVGSSCGLAGLAE